MSFIKNSFLKKRSSTGSSGSGLTPEQEQQLEDLAEGVGLWEPMMIAHELVTTVDGNLVIGKGT